MNLKEQINNIGIIDQHVHVLDETQWVEAMGKFPFPEDTSHLPVPAPLTTLTRVKTLLTAYRELYDFNYSTLTSDNIRELDELYQLSKKDETRIYYRIIERFNIEKAVVVCQNRLELPPGLDPEHFKITPIVDGLLVPLDNSEMKNSFNERATMFILMCEAFLKKMRGNLKINSFEDYLKFLASLIGKIKEKGCVCLKMNFAYWRDIAVDVVSKEEARDVFESNDTSPVRYKHLQDFLLRHIISKAAELDLPIQIHAGSIGVLRPIEESNPSRLEPFLWLPDIKKAKVVLLHGGFPFCREAGFMVSRPAAAPNLYLDISQMWWAHYGSPKALVSILRQWLEMGIAEKLLYASDANSPIGFCMGAMNIREGLYFALKGMIDDGLINEIQALSIAKMILRENAKKLYNI